MPWSREVKKVGLLQAAKGVVLPDPLVLVFNHDQRKHEQDEENSAAEWDHPEGHVNLQRIVG